MPIENPIMLAGINPFIRDDLMGLAPFIQILVRHIHHDERRFAGRIEPFIGVNIQIIGATPLHEFVDDVRGIDAIRLAPISKGEMLIQVIRYRSDIPETMLRFYLVIALCAIEVLLGLVIIDYDLH
jgi:hypothetical protein